MMNMKLLAVVTPLSSYQEGHLNGGRRLARIGPQPLEGTIEVGAAVSGVDQGWYG